MPHQRALSSENATVKAVRSDSNPEQEVDGILRRKGRLHFERPDLRPVPRRIERRERQIEHRRDCDHDDEQRPRLLRDFLDRLRDDPAAARGQLVDGCRTEIQRNQEPEKPHRPGWRERQRGPMRPE